MIIVGTGAESKSRKGESGETKGFEGMWKGQETAATTA
jgi:hypothetical protein